MINLISLYLIVGFIHMFLINFITNRITKLGGKIEYPHSERIMVILVWPVFGFVFWYNFFKTLLDKK